MPFSKYIDPGGTFLDKKTDNPWIKSIIGITNPIGRGISRIEEGYKNNKWRGAFGGLSDAAAYGIGDFISPSYTDKEGDNPIYDRVGPVMAGFWSGRAGGPLIGGGVGAIADKYAQGSKYSEVGDMHLGAAAGSLGGFFGGGSGSGSFSDTFKNFLSGSEAGVGTTEAGTAGATGSDFVGPVLSNGDKVSGGNAMSNLLNNKLFLQYLSSVGSGISQGQPIGQSLDEVTQQNITAQNYANMDKKYRAMFERMMKGEYQEGDSWTEKDGKIVLTMTDPSALEEEGEGTVSPTQGKSTVYSSDKRNTSYSNPLISPDFSSADLAGLTPQMMSQALSDAQKVASIGYMTPAEIQDMAYKQQLIDQSKESILSSQAGRTVKERIYKLPTGEEVGETAYISYLNSHDKEEKPTSVKEYEYAKSQGYKGNLEDWQKSGASDSTSIKEYEKAVAQGYTGKFYDWKKEMTALGGGLDLSERKAIREMEDTVEDKNWFSKPKGGLTDAVEEYITSKEVKKELRQYEDDNTKNKETIRLKEKYIKNKITSSGGKIKGARLDGRTFVWTVEWPDGTTSEVKYAN